MKKLLAGIVAIWLVFPIQGHAQNYRPIMGTWPECISPSLNVIENSDPNTELAYDKALLRVGYWGDPNTAERNGAVSFPVTWNVGQFTGLSGTSSNQRGYWNFDSPRASSAVQAVCSHAGIFMNTFQFNHTSPVFGGGPQASFGEKSSVTRKVFNSNQNELVIQGHINFPWAHWNESGAVGQIVLGYYMQPLRCPYAGNSISKLCPAATL